MYRGGSDSLKSVFLSPFGCQCGIAADSLKTDQQNFPARGFFDGKEVVVLYEDYITV
jgi:hypothetical protein